MMMHASQAQKAVTGSVGGPVVITHLASAIFLAALMALLIAPSVATAQRAAAGTNPAGGDMITSGINEAGEVRLVVNRSTIVTTNVPQKRVSVAEPTIVDVNSISPTRVLLTAKKPGSTQVLVWDDQDRSQTIEVIVMQDIGSLRDQLNRFAGSQIDASMAEDTVVLRGRVPSLSVAEQAEMIASGYGRKVANLIEVSGGQQVMLQVRVAEVSKTAVRQLGVNLGYSDGTSFAASNIGGTDNFNIRSLNANPDASDLGVTSNPVATLFGRAISGNNVFSYFVDALRNNNLLRILAEPNLVAMSGQEASFLAGGEFPVPVPQSGTAGSTTITIEYREFGVKLNFVPIVLGNGRIRLKISPEVSDLDFTTAVRFSGFVVPGLSQRKLTTTVELNESQTLAVAGLLNQSVSADTQAVPVLGDIPFLGSLFRSVRYQRKETELVVFVTPKLVSGMSPDQVPPMPGEVWRHPNDVELYGLADHGGSENGAKTPPRKYVGSYGYAAANDQQHGSQQAPTPTK